MYILDGYLPEALQMKFALFVRVHGMLLLSVMEV